MRSNINRFQYFFFQHHDNMQQRGYFYQVDYFHQVIIPPVQQYSEITSVFSKVLKNSARSKG